MTKGSKGSAEPKKKVLLPPSGLAEDILGARGEMAPPTADLSGPDRIYVFADSVTQAKAEAKGAVPVEIAEPWVVFTLAGESFALPVSHVREILRVGTVTRVPHAPRPVRGVTDIRGHVLPVVDLRLRIGLPEGPVEERSRILVLDSFGRLIGLLVDSVEQIRRIPRSGIAPPPPDILTDSSYYLLGVHHLEGDQKFLILLDVDQILLVRESPEREDERSARKS